MRSAPKSCNHLNQTSCSANFAGRVVALAVDAGADVRELG
jgi:hypothetical protein